MEFTYAILDIALRSASAMMIVLGIFVLARDAGKTRTGWIAIGFLVSVLGYLAGSAPWADDLHPILFHAILVLAMSLGVFLWMLGRALFDDAYQPGWIEPSLFGFFLITGFGRYYFADSWPVELREITQVIPQLIKIAMIAHVFVLALRGYEDDMVEQRRRFRFGFVAVISTLVGIILIVEFILPDNGELPMWLHALNMIGVCGATFITLASLTRLRTEDLVSSLAAPQNQPAPIEAPAEPVDRRALERLVACMEQDRLYLEDELTIGKLARKVGVAEYKLRKLINNALGFRNFTAFLNSYRLADAQAQLADPDKAHLPVLSIALSLGYGSIGPFNRAFKDETGQTPTEFRRTALSPKSG